MEKRGKEEKASKKIPKDYEHTIKLLVENNVTLQRKLVDLTANVQELNKNLSRLLRLIETASDELIHKSGTERHERNERIERLPHLRPKADMDTKIDDLIKQNKTISRGLILLEKYVKEKLGKKSEEEDEEYKPLPDFKF